MTDRTPHKSPGRVGDRGCLDSARRSPSRPPSSAVALAELFGGETGDPTATLAPTPVARRWGQFLPVPPRIPAVHPFRAAVEAGDLEQLIATLAEDVRFYSPVVFKPYAGRDSVGAILRAVFRVFEDFRYEREIGVADDPHHALVFRARVGEREVHGCDFLRTRSDGLVDELTVMVRPLSGALALAEAMRAQLEAPA
jgi:hypothetical protein